MRKYWYIFKSELMSSLQYVFNMISRMISYILMMFIFMNLWKYIYSDPDELINNYSVGQMIWYVIITEWIYFSTRGRNFCNKIINDVRSGNLVYNINKPYNYINYLLASHLGEMTTTFVVFGFIGAILGAIFIGEFPTLVGLQFLVVLLTTILAIIVSTLLVIFIGLFSFIIEDSAPFYWLYSKLMLMFGTLFPIEFFPKWAQVFLNYSPVFASSYGPAKLFVDFSWSNFGIILIAQIAYIIIGYILCLLVYRKGVKRLNVNGG